MRNLWAAAAFAASMTGLGGCATDVFRSEIAQEIELEELVQRERSKWELAAKDPAAFAALLSVDFLSVELGDTRQDPARRLSKEQVVARLPIPAASFDIGDVRVVRPTANSAILSYRVRGANVPFEVFATSHWARRDGEWVTVFYQATSAIP